MTLVEDYSSEALAEVYALLQDRARRMGEFQISDSSLNKVIMEHFGISIWEAYRVRQYVTDYLQGKGILEAWEHKRNCGTVYTVVMHND